MAVLKNGSTFVDGKHIAATEDTMPKAGGTFTGQAIAQSNTAYTIAQLRNIKFKQGTADFTTAELAVGEIGFLYT